MSRPNLMRRRRSSESKQSAAAPGAKWKPPVPFPAYVSPGEYFPPVRQDCTDFVVDAMAYGLGTYKSFSQINAIPGREAELMTLYCKHYCSYRQTPF